MKKIIAFFLVLIMMILYYLFSFIGYTSSWFSPNHEWDGDMLYNKDRLYATVTSDTLIFEKNNIDFDISIGVYDVDIDYIYPDNWPETNHLLAIYISNEKKVPFKGKTDYCNDIKNVDGAKLVRSISYAEAHTEKYGYTSSSGYNIKYNGKEKLTILEEFINYDYDVVYIHVIVLLCSNDLNDNNSETVIKVHRSTTIELEYHLLGDIVIFSP